MNPFSYGKEVTGYQFYDRKDACEDLYHTLKDGSANVVLYVCAAALWQDFSGTEGFAAV